MYKFYPKKWVQPPGRAAKFLLIMKLTTLILVAAILQVSASTFAQRVSLSAKNASLIDVFNQIRTQTGYDFMFTSSLLKDAKPVTLQVKDAELHDVLQKVFEEQPLDFKIDNKSVIISAKGKSVLEKIKEAFTPPLSISGKVQDESGQPLPGVTVRIKGTTIGVITGQKGAFYMTVSDNNAMITFSFVGFETLELPARDIANNAVIKLRASSTNLQEVVVNKGYYSEKQRLSASSAYTVNADVLDKQPVGNFLQALEGRVPGMYLQQTSGVPGTIINVELRGMNNLVGGANNNPLYIVDGIPFGEMLDGSGSGGSLSLGTGRTVGAGGAISPFNSLNMADIENVTVLKDADATAIYGSRGANGVVLITTKKGKAGVTKLDANVYSGAGNVTNMLDLMNTKQYLAMRREAFKNDRSNPGLTDYDINGTWDTTRYTNWQKVFIGNTSHIIDMEASLSGGNANTVFRTSAGYRRETTVYPGDFFDEKTSILMSVNHVSNDRKLNAGFSANFLSGNNTLPGQDFATSGGIFLPPDAPNLYTNTGALNWENNTFNNPFASILNKASFLNDNLLGSATISYQLYRGLKMKVVGSYNLMETTQTKIFPGAAGMPNADGTVSPTTRVNDSGNQSIKTWNIEPQLNYTINTTFGSFDALLGSTIQKSVQTGNSQIALGFSNDVQIVNPSLATIQIINNVSDYQYRYNAIFGRINYNYFDKYLFNITARRDGSSRFGPGKQFGNFGAFGAAWVFSKEPWMKSSRWISFGKLRGSYGTTGSDGIPPYKYLNSYAGTGGNPYLGISGIAPTQIANPYFSWQTVTKLEFGLDISFLQDILNLEATYYHHRTPNQLIQYSLPNVAGFPTLQANLPAVIQNTGIEILLNTNNIKSKKFSWTSSLNITVPRNKLISFENFNSSAYANTYVLGQPITVRKFYHYTGLDPQTGAYTYQDVDNSGGSLDFLKDRQSVINVAKNYFGGFNNSFSYKIFHLDLFLQFVKQKGKNSTLDGRIPGTATNMSVTSLQRWQKVGDITNIPAFTQNYSSSVANSIYNVTSSDLSIVDASFIRLKNVSLAVDFPSRWQTRTHLKNAQIYFSGQNLWTWSKYPGLDPETMSSALPPIRLITTGIRVSL